MDEPITIFGEALARALSRWGMTLSQRQMQLLGSHYQATVDANRSFNLTRITSPTEAAVKHYADSLAVLAWMERSPCDVRSLLDIGTGAGFPAVPLAVMQPELAVTAIEATRKKAEFVDGVATSLGLDHLRAIHAHARHWTADSAFDIVLLRAVGSITSCIKSAVKHVAAGGVIGVYKTAQIDPTELQDARRAADQLGLIALEPFRYDLELDGEVLDRALFVYACEA